MDAPRFNIFQQLVRQWDAVHPYNAAQVLHVKGRPDLLAIRRAWHGTLSASGLGPVRIEGHRFHYEPVNGSATSHDVPLLPPGVKLDQHLSAEMNRPFRDDTDLPLRPFVLEGDGSFHFGVVYHHWIADSASIRLLLREWFVRVYDPAAACDQPVKVPDRGYWAHFGPEQSRWRLGGQVLSLFRSASRFRRVRKVRTVGSNNLDMGFRQHRVPPGTLHGLLGVARRNHVTLNDLFLAAIADVCDRFNPTRHIPRRRDLALGMIVDLRSRTKQDLSRVFGLFLGFANVICKREDLRDWPRLVRQISRQTRLQKETGSAEASTVWMFTALLASRFVPISETFRFYRKHMPLSGGISNVNMNRTWAAKYHPDPLLEYIRVSPTGPMVPLVFTTTTLGEDLVFGLTYRSSLFSDELAERIAATFQARLAQLAECGDALLHV
jgi:hypothetical protein